MTQQISNIEIYSAVQWRKELTWVAVTERHQQSQSQQHSST